MEKIRTDYIYQRLAQEMKLDKEQAELFKKWTSLIPPTTLARCLVAKDLKNGLTQRQIETKYGVSNSVPITVKKIINQVT